MCCDAAIKEAEKTNEICKTLKETEDDGIQKLIKFVKHHRVFFTAIECFELNRSTIPAMINVLTNYLIVIMQFNGISIEQN